MSVFVVDVTAITFALETSGHVHANTVLAHLRHQYTFVDFLGNASHWIDDGSRAITAQREIFP